MIKNRDILLQMSVSYFYIKHAAMKIFQMCRQYYKFE